MIASRNRTGLGALAAALIVAFAYVPQASAAAPEMIKVHRKYRSASSDHLPTNDQNEGAGIGYVYEGSVWMYSRPYGGNGNTPAATGEVFRCFKPSAGRHYANGSCGGDINEGRLGYVLASPRTGHVPLYQCRVSGHNFHYFTSLDANCEGQTYAGLFGYVLPVSSPGEGTLSNGPTNECLGRCGIGCSGWMPVMNVYTSQCLAHDQCVAQNGMLACMNGSLVAAAISYSVMSNLAIVRALGDALKSVFHW